MLVFGQNPKAGKLSMKERFSVEQMIGVLMPA
jgi:hypothetical protein